MKNTALSTKDKPHFGSDVRTITSMEVAEMVGKKYYNLIRDIKGYVEELGELKIEFTDFFREIMFKEVAA